MIDNVAMCHGITAPLLGKPRNGASTIAPNIETCFNSRDYFWFGRYDQRRVATLPRSIIHYIVPCDLSPMIYPHFPIKGGPHVMSDVIVYMNPGIISEPYIYHVYPNNVILTNSSLSPQVYYRMLMMYTRGKIPIDTRVWMKLTDNTINMAHLLDNDIYIKSYYIHNLCCYILRSGNVRAIDIASRRYRSNMLELLSTKIAIDKSHMKFIRQCHRRGMRMTGLIDTTFNIIPFSLMVDQDLSFILRQMMVENVDLFKLLINISNDNKRIDMLSYVYDKINTNDLITLMCHSSHAQEDSTIMLSMLADMDIPCLQRREHINYNGPTFDENMFNRFSPRIEPSLHSRYIKETTSRTALNEIISKNDVSDWNLMLEELKTKPRNVLIEYLQDVDESELESSLRHTHLTEIPTLYGSPLLKWYNRVSDNLYISKELICATCLSPRHAETLRLLHFTGKMSRSLLLDSTILNPAINLISYNRLMTI